MTVLETSFWPRDESVELVDLTVGDLLVERAGQFPDREVLVGVSHDGSAVRLTYAGLLDEARHVGAALATLTEPGDFVALWAPNVIEWPIIQYGAALAGVVLVALNPALRDTELEYALRHSGASLLIHADVSRDYDMASVAADTVTRCPDLDRVISLSDRAAWRAESTDLPAGRAPADADSPVMLQYTSGTTGNPKGVLLRHRSLINVAKLTLEAVGAADGAAAVNPLPMFHTAGCVISTLGPLWIGGKVALVNQFKPEPVLDLLRSEQASILFYVPTILGALLEAQRTSDLPAPKLHTVMGGASNVPSTMIEAAERVFGASVINLFGQTELAPVLTATSPADSRAVQLETVGRPIPQVDCAILDPETNAVVPLGVEGEICARGYQLMVGYLHDYEATKRAVDADGFLHTGDLGTMDQDGYVRVTGRIKDLIIRGGENIAPAEIESCLSEHPAVAVAAVFAEPDDRWGETVAAAVVLRGDAEAPSADTLIAHCRQRLAPHKIPVRWFAVDELPTTPTGKVQKFKLPELIDTSAMTQIA